MAAILQQIEHTDSRLYFLLHRDAPDLQSLVGLACLEYEGGAVRLYCQPPLPVATATGTSAAAAAAAQPSAVRGVSFDQSTTPCATHDFSSRSGCANWWWRYGAVLCAASVQDMPASLDPYRSFSPLSSLSPAANFTQQIWAAKVVVTLSFGASQDPSTNEVVVKISVKDARADARANLLLYGRWARQCTCIKKGDTLLVSGAVLRDLTCDRSDLHPTNMDWDLVVHERTAPDSRLVVLFGTPNADPASLILTNGTLDMPNLTAQIAPPGRQAAGGGSGRGASKRRRAGGGRAGGAADSSYVYTELGSAGTAGKVNVYGVIKEFRLPRATKGTDFVMNITLVDESSPSLGQLSGLQVIY
jgi:hypothetical protein